MRARSRTVTTSVDRGASAVEYGLLMTGIVAVIVAVVVLVGGVLADIFDDSCAATADEGMVGAESDCPPAPEP